ncbi:hypothetical protein [Roseovarius marisflavi]|uniref:hypothetical protein n=1 Tax=Roseovarius marisflavi TaxID=1054996 RepID=UPI000A04AB6D|nr:hypothetical protein [Roseovarius marisflavi]
MKTQILSALASLSLAGASYAEVCEREQTGVATTAEIVEFRLAEGMTDEQFLASAQASTVYLCSTAAFVRRSLSQDETGRWTDYVEWTSKEEAQAAAEAAMQREDMMPFMMAIDPESISLRYAAISSIE